MGTVMEGADDAGMVNNAIKASVSVTANSDQMPFKNQVRPISQGFPLVDQRHVLVVGKRSGLNRESWCQSEEHGCRR